MPRSLVKGRQIKDLSITSNDLAQDSVITEKIKDHNVTCDKLDVGICDRLLRTDSPIGRTKVYDGYPARTDFTIPDGLTYDPATFVERVAVYRNGQLLFNGDGPPVDDRDPVEVWPGSSNTQIVFDMELQRGATIQVIIL